MGHTKAVFVLGENHFRKCFSGNEAVWLVRKILFSGNWNPLTEKNAFDHRNHFTLLFSLQSISGNFIERERARARARGEETFHSVRRSSANSELQFAPIAISPANIPVAVDRNLAKHRSRDRVCRRERKIWDRDWRFARSRRRSRSHEDCDLAFARSRRQSRSREEGEIAIAPSIAISDCDRRCGRRTGFVVELDLGCGLCFSRFVFSFFFSKHQKIFSGKFFEMQPNTWKHFPFSEISISGKYVFSGKHFTATKHSLRMWEEGAPRYYIPEISHNYSLVYPIVYQILKTFFFRF